MRSQAWGPYMSVWGQQYEHKWQWCLAIRPLVGRGRGLIQGAKTIVLTLVDLTPMWLSSNDAKGPNLQQQEPSLETMVYNKWPEPVLPGE